jgi:hypothetical protein
MRGVNVMKKGLIIIMLVIASSAAYAEGYRERGGHWRDAYQEDAGSGEFRFLLNGFIPLSDDENWDSAYGLDAELVNWVSPAVGFAAVVGATRWDAREYELSDYYPDSGTSVNARISGDALVCPVGLSVLLRPVKSRAAEVTLEAGLRYAFVDSDVTARYEISGPSGTVREVDRIDIQDGAYGLVALDFAFPLTPHARISLGAGYQFDLSDNDAEFGDADIGDSDFEASIVRLGFHARF